MTTRTRAEVERDLARWRIILDERVHYTEELRVAYHAVDRAYRGAATDLAAAEDEVKARERELATLEAHDAP